MVLCTGVRKKLLCCDCVVKKVTQLLLQMSKGLARKKFAEGGVKRLHLMQPSITGLGIDNQGELAWMQRL